ncbi:Phosphoenolpyruvate/pyruvate domain-containing protein [Pluteus cervinus]|uniref:Phosphoenolpyruvate/pyruvate domain-containing protein n=1 Tax=Pluteus cervinus TaxID=181527 RepID=A0ACD3AD22_9AGAR|nr:Phosphoenolpyruvate/pyruvate domain-containing protein [Pluteus cervinus]
MTAHAILNAFKAGRPAFGAWLTVPGYFHARTVAQASPNLSWIMVDCEHGLVPLVPGAAESIAAIHGAVPNGESPSALVRIPATGVSASTSWQIKYALDAGARGILVPMISTVEKAREVVADSRFPPVGRRGFGSPFAHGNWGVTVQDYLKTANESVLVMIQIETKEAVENVEQIAAVDGIDVLLIGPYDLSISLGYPTPSPDPHPEVEKAIQRILKSSHAAGKKCAIFCTSGAQSAKRAEEGFDMINVTTDTGAMTEAIAGHLQSALAFGGSK